MRPTPQATCRQDDILHALKRLGPSPVRDLAAQLSLSYMGTKRHCLLLEKSGLLASSNLHRGPGRPLLVYRLTRRGEAWFEENDHAATISILRHAISLFGPASAGKLLLLYSQEREAHYRSLVPASSPLAEKMALLAAARDAEGRMTTLDPGVALVEHHNPDAALHRAFPEAATLEESLVRRILGVPVRRRTLPLGDQYAIRFELHTPLAHRPQPHPTSPGSPPAQEQDAPRGCPP